MVFLRADAAAEKGVPGATEPVAGGGCAGLLDQQQAQHWIEGHTEDCCCQHGEVLGVGERLEELPFWAFQDQDRQERYRDDQQSEERGSADFFDGLENYLVVLERLAGALGLFELLVRLLDDYDGGVDQASAGNGDACQGHNVDADSGVLQRDEGQQHGDGDGDDWDGGAGEMPEEDEDDQKNRYDDFHYR